jgi:triacylglycerol lipase
MAEDGQAGMKPHVIVLHGLALNKWWTEGLADSLQGAGYEVHNVTYPSRKSTFDEIVSDFLHPLMESISGKKIHFVAHSMGGILVRLYAKKYGTKRIGRVVMMGTPNNGSEAADVMGDMGVFQLFFGATGQGLGTTDKDMTMALGPVTFECGIIAGESQWFHFPTTFMTGNPKPNDGIVSVASTKVEGMADHITLPVEHSKMVWNPEVWRLATAFLKNGKFG